VDDVDEDVVDDVDDVVEDVVVVVEISRSLIASIHRLMSGLNPGQSSAFFPRRLAARLLMSRAIVYRSLPSPLDSSLLRVTLWCHDTLRGRMKFPSARRSGP
jgi:hypothetical protein